MTEVTSLPSNIVIDLDAAERPAEDVKPPFVANIAGREIEMKDPSDLDWRDLMAMTDPSDFPRLSLSADDRSFLSGQNIPAWKFNLLMEAFYRHYDLEELAARAKRESTLRSV